MIAVPNFDFNTTEECSPAKFAALMEHYNTTFNIDMFTDPSNIFLDSLPLCEEDINTLTMNLSDIPAVLRLDLFDNNTQMFIDPSTIVLGPIPMCEGDGMLSSSSSDMSVIHTPKVLEEDTKMVVNTSEISLDSFQLCEEDRTLLLRLLNTPSTPRPDITEGPVAVRKYLRTFCEARQECKKSGLPNVLEFTPERKQRRRRKSPIKGI